MKKLKAFEAHLNKRYGRKGSTGREKFEAESLAFRLGEILKRKEGKPI